MNLGFKDRFVPMVEDGSKTHSVRAGDRWRVGMRADCYARPRQKDMRLLLRAPVVRVETIAIGYDRNRSLLAIEVEGIRLTDDEANSFAWKDGFRLWEWHSNKYPSLREMYDFWRREHRKPGMYFSGFHGQIIHWDYAARFTDLDIKPERAVRIPKAEFLRGRAAQPVKSVAARPLARCV